MPQSPTSPRGGSSRGGSSRSGSSKRSAPTKVSKPFPWGTVLGSVVLALVLGGVLVYAVLNTGKGVPGTQTDPDNNIEGVVVADAASLTRTHVPGAVDYPTLPPPGGDHSITPQQCAVYTEAIAPEHAVHSLEHGAVWITYQPSLADDQVEELADKAQGDQYLIMSPLPEQDSPVVLTSWGRTLALDSANDPRVDDFIDAYRNGPGTPERGAACSGTTDTGPVAPAPAAPPAPSPAAG